MCRIPWRPEAKRPAGVREADRGAVDVSIEMLFGLLFTLFVVLALFEATAYWHARNVFDDAASEGARIAAAFDGSCADGIAFAQQSIARHAGSWARDVTISCSEGATVAVTVAGRTPGILSGGTGFTARVTETASKEG